MKIAKSYKHPVIRQIRPGEVAYHIINIIITVAHHT